MNQNTLAFRPVRDPAPAEACTALAVGQMIDEAVQPGHFFVAPQLQLAWDPPRSELVPWEVFRGTLVDVAQSRQTRRFLSWHVRGAGAPEPLLSVRFDVEQQIIHVTRGLLCYAWEGYDSGGGVILSREVERWQRELVGSIALERFTSLQELRDELICTLWQAVAGTSRLPLTSVEAPLPAFSLGQLAYVYRHGLSGDELQAPLRSHQDLIELSFDPSLAWRERVKLLEMALRAPSPDAGALTAVAFQRRQQPVDPADKLRLVRSLFNDASLSPFTGFVDAGLEFVCGVTGFQEREDFLDHLLRQLCRHLSAYDLVTFHHRGANYPDALLLDAALKAYLALCQADPESFQGDAREQRRRRRALRQACLLRRHYEGHLVPDAPTSPGENARVVAGQPRLPEEQLLQPARRRRALFKDEPLVKLLTPADRCRVVLERSFADLAHADERRELGMALFIDRPLGYGKLPGEPDLTPLLAHEAHSQQLARRRLQELVELGKELGIPVPEAAHGIGPCPGLASEVLAEPARPAAALTDVRRVASDFVIVRTLPRGVAELAQICDLSSICAACRPRVFAQVRRPGGAALTVFDEDFRPRFELLPDLSRGYARRAGIEFPVAGVRVVRIDAPGQ